MRVCALVGSADFLPPKSRARLDGTRARRSPGSTLKPFIYALALEQGLIHPRSILDDSPKSFWRLGDPEKLRTRVFGGRFPLPMPWRPAEICLPCCFPNSLPRQGFMALKRAHVELPKDAGHYGLALALGGAEVSMRELAGLYAMLANQGIWRPCEWQGKIAKRRSPAPAFAGKRPSCSAHAGTGRLLCAKMADVCPCAAKREPQTATGMPGPLACAASMC